MLLNSTAMKTRLIILLSVISFALNAQLEGEWVVCDFLSDPGRIGAVSFKRIAAVKTDESECCSKTTLKIFKEGHKFSFFQNYYWCKPKERIYKLSTVIFYTTSGTWLYDGKAKILTLLVPKTGNSKEAKYIFKIITVSEKTLRLKKI